MGSLRPMEPVPLTTASGSTPSFLRAPSSLSYSSRSFLENKNNSGKRRKEGRKERWTKFYDSRAGSQSREKEGEHGGSTIYRQAGRQSTRRGGEGREGRKASRRGRRRSGGGGTTNSMGISNGAERGTRECPRAKGNPFLTLCGVYRGMAGEPARRKVLFSLSSILVPCGTPLAISAG